MTKLPFLDHLKALRLHLIRIFLLFFAILIFVFYYLEPWISWLKRPLTQSTSLIAIEVFEVIMTNLKIGFLTTLILVFPYALFEVWKFLKPGLMPKEIKFVKNLMISATILFYIGIVVGFYFLVPVFLDSALGLAKQYTTVQLTYNNYFNSIIMLTMIFGLVFETPVILAILILLEIVSVKTIQKNRRILIVVCFILGAFLSPPDVVSQILISLPLWALIEVSLLFLSRLEKNRK